MKSPTLLLLLICAAACSGCVTVGHKFVGRDAAEVARVVQANFPIGGSISTARDELESNGFICKAFTGGMTWIGAALVKTDGITCSGPNLGDPRMIKLHIGGLWVVELTQENGLITSQRLEPFGTPYS